MADNEFARPHGGSDGATDLKAITEALRGLRFGVVSIIVQDGVIVQIDRTEKRRFRRKAQGSEAEAVS